MPAGPEKDITVMWTCRWNLRAWTLLGSYAFAEHVADLAERSTPRIQRAMGSTKLQSKTFSDEGAGRLE